MSRKTRNSMLGMRRILRQATTYHEFIEKERAFYLLSGLQNDFDQIKGQILGKKNLPFLRKAFTIVERERLDPNPMDGLALATTQQKNMVVTIAG